jgi:hypothetical protein
MSEFPPIATTAVLRPVVVMVAFSYHIVIAITPF